MLSYYVKYYLKVTIENKNWHSQNFNFTGMENLSPCQVWEVVAFLLFSLWKELWRFKVKESCILLSKNINFNKNKTESKMENPTHSFRETNLVHQLIYKSQTKSKTDKLELTIEKRTFFIYVVYFVCLKEFLFNICVWSQFSVLNTLSEYTYFNIPKNITSYTFVVPF